MILKAFTVAYRRGGCHCIHRACAPARAGVNLNAMRTVATVRDGGTSRVVPCRQNMSSLPQGGRHAIANSHFPSNTP